MALRNTYLAFKALRDRLLTITGATAGYWHDVGGKVYSRVMEPGAPGSPDAPYICLYLADKGEIEHLETEALDYTISPEIVVFLPMNDGEDIETGQAADACKWLDDLLLCLWPADGEQWNLGSPAVVEVTLRQKQIMADPPDGLHPFVSVLIDLRLITTRAELGSGA